MNEEKQVNQGGLRTTGTRALKLAGATLALLVLAGCARGVPLEVAATFELVGFWSGLWHGLILPISFVVSIFSEETAIYAVYNNGGWYDAGFLLGACSSLGGSGSASSRRR